MIPVMGVFTEEKVELTVKVANWETLGYNGHTTVGTQI